MSELTSHENECSQLREISNKPNDYYNIFKSDLLRTFIVANESMTEEI